MQQRMNVDEKQGFYRLSFFNDVWNAFGLFYDWR
jgi:hypothetical protein